MTKIYLITNLINGKQYVGKTKHSLQHRFAQHCNNDHYKTHLHYAIKKYGKENFKIELICTCRDDCWKEQEQYYIKKFHTHHSEGGYNITWGGDSNPMDDDYVKSKHRKLMSTPEHRAMDREIIQRYNNSDKRKLDDLKTSERQKGIYVKQFQDWNNSTKKPIAMVDDDGNEIMRFESCSDACRYISDVEGRFTNRGHISAFKKFADKINKNGKRAKFLGHCWKML